MKTAAPKPESGENNAFSLGKQCFYRGKTSDLSRENLHAAEGKHTLYPAQTDVFPSKKAAHTLFLPSVGTDGEKVWSAKKRFLHQFVFQKSEIRSTVSGSRLPLPLLQHPHELRLVDGLEGIVPAIFIDHQHIVHQRTARHLHGRTALYRHHLGQRALTTA